MREGKKLAVFMVIASAAFTFSTSPVLAGSQKSYGEAVYDTDIVSESDWENTEIGEYPLTPDSEIWSELSSVEASAACDVPEEYAKSLTTEELVDYAVNYPILMDLLMFDSLKVAFKVLEEKSGVFAELFSRDDAAGELLKEYQNLDIDYAAEGLFDKGYEGQMFMEVYFGLNYNVLPESIRSEFVSAYGEKYEKMSVAPESPVFSTMFYAALEEAVGKIPKEAIPDSAADDPVIISIVENPVIDLAAEGAISGSARDDMISSLLEAAPFTVISFNTWKEYRQKQNI